MLHILKDLQIYIKHLTSVLIHNLLSILIVCVFLEVIFVFFRFCFGCLEQRLIHLIHTNRLHIGIIMINTLFQYIELIIIYKLAIIISKLCKIKTTMMTLRGYLT